MQQTHNRSAFRDDSKRCQRTLVSLVLTLFFSFSAAEPAFFAECPLEGSNDKITNPTRWADRCFEAVNGRPPVQPDESRTVHRDINLDGSLEQLEIRGTGQRTKQIYVFQDTGSAYRYLGRLDAHPSFRVVQENDIATIIYTLNSGQDEQTKRVIQYDGNVFRTVRTEALPDA